MRETAIASFEFVKPGVSYTSAMAARPRWSAALLCRKAKE